MPLPNILALLVLFVGVPLNILVTLMLWRQSHDHPHITVLRERFIVAVAVLILVIVFALIFQNNDRMPPYLTTDVTKVVTRFVLFAVAVIPALYWLHLYRRSLWHERRVEADIKQRNDTRDAARDLERDTERDTARDVARDVGRDAPRDLERDTRVDDAS